MQGKTALVTGGGSGIGLATAKLFLERGANVVISGRTQSTLVEAAETLGNSDRLQWYVADVSSEGHVRTLVANTIKRYGGLDFLVNNAGAFSGAPILQMEEEDFEYNINNNLKSAWLMSKYAARHMVTAGGGAIVNLSSYLAIRAHPKQPSSAYAAAKAGVLGLTRSLSVELAPHKIRVNAVIPAVVNTPMLSEVVGPDAVPKVLELSKQAHPIGRAGEPDDVARLIVFLSDTENSWLTGAEICIDGGRSVL